MIPTSPLGPMEISTTHTPHVDNDIEYDFPLEGFPYEGRFPSQMPPVYSGPLLPHDYTTLAQLVSETPSASSFYQNPIWSSNAMPTSSSFIPNMTSHFPVQTVITSVMIQLMILSQLLPLFQPSILVQPTVSVYTSVSSSIPPSSR